MFGETLVFGKGGDVGASGNPLDGRFIDLDFFMSMRGAKKAE